MKQFHFGAANSSCGPTRGNAFQAEYEETHISKSTNESIRASGRYFQDSQGRTRRDITTLSDPPEPGQPTRMAMISDPVADAIVFVDLDSNSARRLQPGLIHAEGAQPTLAPIPQGESCPSPPPAPLVWRSQSLGTKTIEGLDCQGELILIGSEGESVESWFSTQLSACVFYKQIRGDVEVLYRLFDIQLTEPDPSLFLASGAP